ncbi:cell division protein ZapE [Streptomyces sulfonofaciens]|uniref:cell division protein ZapE n=1 Tax=Streptomyces sulfonofaciens TaxID=68272 RepID=UPI001E48A950|nr:cell division protein ZapE [Streptomyces sulfonofaciens]
MSSSPAPAGPGSRSAVQPVSLCARAPEVGADRLIAGLVPPPRFGSARFDTYAPDPDAPGQAAAVRALTAFAAGLGSGRAGQTGRRRWFGARAGRTGGDGVYLDGGFGVGKTHLLAALWHAAPAPPEHKAFCTFAELTQLAGALGFQRTVRALSGHRLVCIDEFELDDPGDTVLVSSLLDGLGAAGVALAATSNTLPDRLGEGRFAAEDFRREIQGLAARFRTLRVDGADHRHRGMPAAPPPYSEEQVAAAAHRLPGAGLDDFPRLLDHLAHLHPSRYGALLDGVTALCLTGVRPVPDEAAALRLVVLADRLYDREIPVLASGEPLDRVFGDRVRTGGYRKKYLRALSRLSALTREAVHLGAPVLPAARLPAEG